MSAGSDANTSVSPMSALDIKTLTGRQAELSILDELFSSGVGAVANIGSVGAAPSDSSDSIQGMAGGLNDTEEAAASQENCTNVMCIPDADYLEEIWDYIFPSPFEWIFIGLHVVVFFMGLIGNSLVVYAVMRGKNMRSVTNTFIVNLAVADFLLLLICQPSSLLVDATETWYLGNALCKFITYFQSVNNFFLWAYLKEKVYINKPETLQDLKEKNIRNEIGELNHNRVILQSVMDNVLERARVCEAETRNHLKDVIFA